MARLKKGDSGYIYVATNESLAGLVKLGIASDVKLRMRQLSSHSGVPTPFLPAKYIWVTDACKIEKALKTAFSFARKAKEFYEIDVVCIIAILDLLAGDAVDMSSEVRKDIKRRDPLGVEESDKKRERRANYTFEILGIPDGAEISFRVDPSIKATVRHPKQVLFDGVHQYLATATRKLMGAKPFDALYQWTYNEKILRIIYDEKIR